MDHDWPQGLRMKTSAKTVDSNKLTNTTSALALCGGGNIIN
jgi:hypothetical protein